MSRREWIAAGLAIALSVALIAIATVKLAALLAIASWPTV